MIANQPCNAPSRTPPKHANASPPQGDPELSAPSAARKAPNSMMPSTPTLRTPERCPTSSPSAAIPIDIASRIPAARRPARRTASMSGDPMGASRQRRSECKERQDHDALNDPDQRERHGHLPLHGTRSDKKHTEQQGGERNGKRAKVGHERNGDRLQAE